MRFVGCSVILACGLFAAAPAIAQQAGTRLSAAQTDIGRVETRIQKYDQALGVVTRFARPQGSETECDGACYYASGSKRVSWKCAPGSQCSLHCMVNPPVGGCD